MLLRVCCAATSDILGSRAPKAHRDPGDPAQKVLKAPYLTCLRRVLRWIPARHAASPRSREDDEEGIACSRIDASRHRAVRLQRRNLLRRKSRLAQNLVRVLTQSRTR